MPDVRFEDVLVINPSDHEPMVSSFDAETTKKTFDVEIDEKYLFVCEEGRIKPISHAPSSPCSCGLKVKGGKLEVTVIGNMPDEIVVKLSGVRKGFDNKRFEEFSHAQMIANTSFWNKWNNGS
jgi:hypothetical protein